MLIYTSKRLKITRYPLHTLSRGCVDLRPGSGPLQVCQFEGTAQRRRWHALKKAQQVSRRMVLHIKFNQFQTTLKFFTYPSDSRLIHSRTHSHPKMAAASIMKSLPEEISPPSVSDILLADHRDCICLIRHFRKVGQMNEKEKGEKKVRFDRFFGFFENPRAGCRGQ